MLYDKIVMKLQSQRESISKPTRLPVERVMAKEYEVGRDTVRRALAKLQKEGAVSRRQGSGTYLHPAGVSTVEDIRGCNIGFVPPWWADSTSSWFTSNVFDGVARWADTHECHISVLHAERRSNHANEWFQRLESRKIAGVVWVHPAAEQLPLIEQSAKQLPCVVLGRHYPDRGLNHVIPDYDKAVQLIDQYLVGRGHASYTVIGASIQEAYAQSWLQALGHVYEKRGAWFNVKQNFVDIKPFVREKLAQLLLEFCEPMNPDSKAYVLTSSSYLTPLIADEAFRKRLREDLSVVTFDFGLYPMGAYWPGHEITHVGCDWPKIGQKAMDVLALLASDEQVPEIIREPVTFIEGQTVHFREKINEVIEEQDSY